MPPLSLFRDGASRESPPRVLRGLLSELVEDLAGEDPHAAMVTQAREAEPVTAAVDQPVFSGDRAFISGFNHISAGNFRHMLGAAVWIGEVAYRTFQVLLEQLLRDQELGRLLRGAFDGHIAMRMGMRSEIHAASGHTTYLVPAQHGEALFGGRGGGRLTAVPHGIDRLADFLPRPPPNLLPQSGHVFGIEFAHRPHPINFIERHPASGIDVRCRNEYCERQLHAIQSGSNTMCVVSIA